METTKILLIAFGIGILIIGGIVFLNKMTKQNIIYLQKGNIDGISLPAGTGATDLWNYTSGYVKQSVNDSGISLSKWGGEAGLFISLPTKTSMTTTATGAKGIGSKLTYNSVESSNEFYMKDPENFEWEIILNSKPSRNTFEYDMETKGLTCYEQVPLTIKYAEDKNANCTETTCFVYDKPYSEKDARLLYEEGILPEYIGSQVCLYNKTGNKYENGFGFMINQIKIADSSDKKSIGMMKISNGKLSITVDQKFLDTAIYPVIIDPGFGNAGTSPVAYTSMGNNTKLGFKIQSNDDGGIQEGVYGMRVYTVIQNNNTMCGAMYGATGALGNTPLNKLGDTTNCKIGASVGSYEYYNFTDIPVIDATTYYIALGTTQNGSTSSARFWATASTGGIGRGSDGIPSASSIFETVNVNTTLNYMAYVNYTFRPTYSSMSIVPIYPNSSTTWLNCTSLFSDADNTSLRYEYLLYNGSTLYNSTNLTGQSNVTSNTINWSVTLNNNEKWTCKIRVKDNYIYSNFSEVSVTVNNNATVNATFITPDTPTDDNNLTCFGNWTDVDNSTQNMSNVFTWFKNGTSVNLVDIPFDNDIYSSNYSQSLDILPRGNSVGAYRGRPTFEPSGCVQGGCYKFNGSTSTIGDSFKVLANTNNSNLTNFTVMLWMMPYDYTSAKVLVSKDYSTSFSPESFVLYYERDAGADTYFTTTIGTGVDDYGSMDTVSFGSDVVNKWVHVAVVVTSQSNLSLYVNGTLLSSTPLTAFNFVNDTSNLWSIGHYTGSNSYQHRGKIDNFRIVNASLTGTQIRAIVNEEVKGLVNTSIIDSSRTTVGDVWLCKTFATDSFLYSVQKNSSVFISSGGEPANCWTKEGYITIIPANCINDQAVGA